MTMTTVCIEINDGMKEVKYRVHKVVQLYLSNSLCFCT